MGVQERIVGDNDPLSLDEACSVILRGLAVPSTLRTAIAGRKLKAMKIGKRYIVTPAAVREWMDKCLVTPKAPARTSNRKGRTPPVESSKPQSGSSETAPVNAALASLELTLATLQTNASNKRSEPTSGKGTTRPQARVIPLRSKSLTS